MIRAHLIVTGMVAALLNTAGAMAQ